MFTQKEISEVCKDFGLRPSTTEVVQRYCRSSSVRIIEGAQSNAAGVSKWWGEPDLALSYSSPGKIDPSFRFICQIRLADLPRRDWRSQMPTDGLLSIFIADDARRSEVQVVFQEAVPTLNAPTDKGSPSRAMLFEQEFLFPDPSSLLGLLPADEWGEFVDFFKELHLDPPSISSSSHLLCPTIEGYNQTDLTFSNLIRSVMKVTGRALSDISSAELSTWGVFAYLDLPNLARRVLVLSRGDSNGRLDTSKFFLSFGEG